MERNFAVVTIFSLLFAVTSARISLDPKPTDSLVVQTNCGSNSDPNLVTLPIEAAKSESEADQVQKSDLDRMFRVNLTPRSDYARFHAINRRFSDHHRPDRNFQNPFVKTRSEISHGSELILNTDSGKFDARNLHRHGASSRLKFKHDYRHRHRHQHHQIHRNNDDVSMPKHKFVREKAKSLVNQHREHEASSFMKNIRKFLKHTFD